MLQVHSAPPHYSNTGGCTLSVVIGTFRPLSSTGNLLGFNRSFSLRTYTEIKLRTSRSQLHGARLRRSHASAASPSPMALKLSTHSITHLPISPERIHRSFQRSPPATVTPLPSFTGFGCSLVPVSATIQCCGHGGRLVTHAVKEEQSQSASMAETQNPETTRSSSKLVLVVGGSGGVGQLIVASLLSRNIRSRLLLRDPTKAASLFVQDEDTLQVCQGDTRNPGDLDQAVFEGVTHVICCTGTTAFPSRRWDGDNTPERVDWEGIRNLVSALPPTLERFVLVSSIGVTKFNELPWSIMNLFGVLKYKKMGEDFVRSSSLPFTIIRAGRLTDGPYTSYDLNTLLKATAGKRLAVVIDQGDKLVGEVSRLVVAEACIQALDIECTRGQIYEINSIEGEGPGKDPEKWKELFKAAAVN